MKISTKGRYALRFMVELSRADKGQYIPIKKISEEQDISEKYLEQIVRMLVANKLIVSTRGAQGGYALARPANTITVGDVLRTCEGDLGPVDCVRCGGEQCPRESDCDTLIVWQKIKEATDKVVDSISLQDLATQRVSTDAALDSMYGLI